MLQLIEKTIKKKIIAQIETITPLDSLENKHIDETIKWISSGADIFRRKKPDIPPKHLVSYFILFDEVTHKILLVDHIKSGLWLPTGGHIEPNEDPIETVRREAQEELGIIPNFYSFSPFFLTITQTIGQTAGHTDVSLWYLIKASEQDSLNPNLDEFHSTNWFSIETIPVKKSDPHIERFVKKLKLSIKV